MLAKLRRFIYNLLKCTFLLFLLFDRVDFWTRFLDEKIYTTSSLAYATRTPMYHLHWELDPRWTRWVKIVRLLIS